MSLVVRSWFAAAILLLTLFFGVRVLACSAELVAFSEPDESDYVGSARLTVPQLALAYENGIFPWTWDDESQTAGFYSVAQRGVLFFDELHVPKNLTQFVRQHGAEYEVTFDRAFDRVVTECAEMPRKQDTWITPAFRKVQSEMFQAGLSHSVEVWEKSTGELVGGLYGVYVGHIFSWESMFHKRSNVTKLAVLALIERLKGNGHHWFDTQQVSALPKIMGARFIPRDEYQSLLRATSARRLPF
jgi:leucyl/phenylalanyl-tRNA---protein transferase